MGDFYSNYTHNHKQPPKSGFGFLEAVIEGAVARTGDLAVVLDAPHEHGGNPGFAAALMLRAFIMQYALSERYANGFLNRLGSDERLLRICGLEHAPSEGAYSRFKKKLAPYKDAFCVIISEVFLGCGEEIERMREEGLIPEDTPPLGHSLAMDSTDVEAWARPGRTSRKTGEEIPSKDPDTAWGHRTAKNPRSSKPRSSKQGKSKSKTPKAKGDNTDAKDSNDELYFGYKINTIVDANHGLPLFAATRPANASDVSVMVEDLEACLALYPTLKRKYFLTDKGYDKPGQHGVCGQCWHDPRDGGPASREGQGDRPAAVRRDLRRRRPADLHRRRPMEYVETDLEKGHLFRCPSDGCALKETVQFTRHCDYAHYEKPEKRLLRIVGLLPRCSEEWKTEYKKRPTIERYFSSDKHSRMLDTHRYLNGQKVELHVMMSMLSYLATALAHLKANDYTHMRHMRIKLPAAKRATEKMEPKQGIDPGIVTALVLHELNAAQKAA